ncbi:MAG TPA: hypothetical protein VFF39_10395, partial [Verrucomicrobiae bacterium]|nr:hypothetical protein [Verrucomicrobiae bacterium]
DKWDAVENKQIPRFLLSASGEAARRFAEQFPLLRWLRRCRHPVITRQKVGWFASTSLLHIAGRSGPSAWLLSAQAAVLMLASLWSCWFLAGPSPDLGNSPRWFPRTENSVAINDLQLDFNDVCFFVEAEDYFVVVEGHTSPAPPSADQSQSPRIASVYGEASLERSRWFSQTAVAVVHLRAEGAVPDPHLLQVELFQRRHLLGWQLPPRRLRAFGIPTVSIAQARTKP